VTARRSFTAWKSTLAVVSRLAQALVRLMRTKSREDSGYKSRMNEEKVQPLMTAIGRSFTHFFEMPAMWHVSTTSLTSYIAKKVTQVLSKVCAAKVSVNLTNSNAQHLSLL